VVFEISYAVLETVDISVVIKTSPRESKTRHHPPGHIFAKCRPILAILSVVGLHSAGNLQERRYLERVATLLLFKQCMDRKLEILGVMPENEHGLSHFASLKEF